MQTDTAERSMASRNVFGIAAVTAACMGLALAVQAQSIKPAPAKDAPVSGIARNPYLRDAAAVAEGGELFDANACSSCHGANAQGGVCPSLVNAAWVYGSDDATLFDLIQRGSVAMLASGHVRGTNEKSSGNMPPFAGMLNDADTWKVIAWIRSKYIGNPALRNW